MQQVAELSVPYARTPLPLGCCANYIVSPPLPLIPASRLSLTASRASSGSPRVTIDSFKAHPAGSQRLSAGQNRFQTGLCNNNYESLISAALFSQLTKLDCNSLLLSIS